MLWRVIDGIASFINFFCWFSTCSFDRDDTHNTLNQPQQERTTYSSSRALVAVAFLWSICDDYVVVLPTAVAVVVGHNNIFSLLSV